MAESVPWSCGCGAAGEASSEGEAWAALLRHLESCDHGITVTVGEPTDA